MRAAVHTQRDDDRPAWARRTDAWHDEQHVDVVHVADVTDIPHLSRRPTISKGPFVEIDYARNATSHNRQPRASRRRRQSALAGFAGGPALPQLPEAPVCWMPGLIRGDLQALLAVACKAQQPPSSTLTSVLVRTTTNGLASTGTLLNPPGATGVDTVGSWTVRPST